MKIWVTLIHRGGIPEMAAWSSEELALADAEREMDEQVNGYWHDLQDVVAYIHAKESSIYDAIDLFNKLAAFDMEVRVEELAVASQAPVAQAVES